MRRWIVGKAKLVFDVGAASLVLYLINVSDNDSDGDIITIAATDC
jgi:hypothetical protein